jgi:hypothetical protein
MRSIKEMLSLLLVMVMVVIRVRCTSEVAEEVEITYPIVGKSIALRKSRVMRKYSMRRWRRDSHRLRCWRLLTSVLRLMKVLLAGLAEEALGFLFFFGTSSPS